MLTYNQEVMTGNTNKVQVKMHTHNLNIPNFGWCFGHVNDQGMLESNSMVLRCKDHLVECLLANKYMPGLGLSSRINRKTPITLFVFKPRGQTNFLSEGIKTLLNPLEAKYKWKPTTVEFVDNFSKKNMWGNVSHYDMFKVTASKMWLRNGFLFSIWASLLRIGAFVLDVTPDNVIELCRNHTRNHCNEIGYIIYQSEQFGKEKYQALWYKLLNSLHKYKAFYKNSVHERKEYHTHGTEGPFYCIQTVENFKYSPEASIQALKSHPFAKEITYDILPESLRNSA